MSMGQGMGTRAADGQGPGTGQGPRAHPGEAPSGPHRCQPRRAARSLTLREGDSTYSGKTPGGDKKIKKQRNRQRESRTPAFPGRRTDGMEGSGEGTHHPHGRNVSSPKSCRQANYQLANHMQNEHSPACVCVCVCVCPAGDPQPAEPSLLFPPRPQAQPGHCLCPQQQATKHLPSLPSEVGECRGFFNFFFSTLLLKGIFKSPCISRTLVFPDGRGREEELGERLGGI